MATRGTETRAQTSKAKDATKPATAPSATGKSAVKITDKKRV